MRVIIAGGRDVNLTLDDFARLDALDAEIGIKEVVSGGAPGVDADGERWGHRRGKDVKRFIAEWARCGNFAGPLRNSKMADNADAVVLFRGGKGTLSMKRIATEKGLRVFDWRKAS